jgi:hypothetical protein
LDAALFYASDNFVGYKEAVSALEDDAQSVAKVQAAFNNKKVLKELALIKTHAKHPPAVMTSLEGQNLSLAEQLKSLELVKKKLEAVSERDGGQILRDKYRSVFKEENEGLQLLVKIDR